MIRGKIVYVAAVVMVSLIISGCVSAPPKVSPLSTPVPTTAVPTPTSQPVTTIPAATPSVPPAIQVTSYPPSANGEENFTIQWEVAGGAPGNISKTGVQWGYSANYTRESKALTGKTPERFSIDLKAPAGGDLIYFRVYATVDGVNLYSPEYQIAINPRYTGGGGGY